MNLSKVLEFFDANELLGDEYINIVGCGAIGSHVAETLARVGCTNMVLWDFDKVEAHNITNQMFTHNDIDLYKVDAVADMLYAINPDITVTRNKAGLQHPHILSGYVFLCVDNIDLRREIVLANQFNKQVLAFFDFRMGLTDAQHYAAHRQSPIEVTNLLKSMDFTHEEAAEATPVSACNVELSVITTVKIITALGVDNFMKTVMGLDYHTTQLVDIKNLTFDSLRLR